MEKNNALVASIVLIFLSIGVLSWIFLFPSPQTFKYRLEYENIVFLSNQANPAVLLKQLSTKKTFIVSPTVKEDEKNLAEVNDVVVLFQAVFAGSDKNAVTLIRETDSKGKLLRCHSNLGDVHESYELMPKECLTLLKEENSVKVIIEEKSQQNQKSKVIVEENKITVFPSPAPFEASRVSVTILKTMFADTEQIINAINQFIG
jgi:hypothetical protein